MKTDSTSILRQLNALAPSIAFSTHRDIDRDFPWDGDGPDPLDEGFECYQVTVSAKAIIYGHEITGEDRMGGHYDKPGELDADLGGYLPQMFDEAAEDLAKQIRTSAPEFTALLDQLAAVDAYLAKVLRARYNEQMRPRVGQPA